MGLAVLQAAVAARVSGLPSVAGKPPVPVSEAMSGAAPL